VVEVAVEAEEMEVSGELGGGIFPQTSEASGLVVV
tara:strand:+ start:44 stop:148 length:105 start_codon:yes stop_codon:yes gene_type:complete